MEDVKYTSSALQKFMSLLLAVIMCFSFGTNLVLAETTTYGNWTIDNDSTPKTAKIKDMDFTYYNYTAATDFSTFSTGSGDEAKRGVGIGGSESAANGAIADNGIVTTDGSKSYCEYQATKDGTLTVYVKYASSGKTLAISKKNIESGEETAVGKCDDVATATDGNENIEELKISRKNTAYITADIEVKSGYTYYICLKGSKMTCYGAEFVPYTQLTGIITDKFNISDFGIKFTNSETGQVKIADVDTTNKTYSIKIKPGVYSASLTGSSAEKYSLTQATRTVKPTGETMTANLEIEECVSYNIKGSLNGFANGYDLTDLELKFMPEDSNDFQPAAVEIDKDNLTYSALLVSGEKYTLTKKGANDYDFTETITVKNTVQKKPDIGETTYIYGDADGDKYVKVNDAAILLARVLDGNSKLPIEDQESDKYIENYMEFVDIDDNGILTATDAAMILKKALDSSFLFPGNKNDNSASGDDSISEGDSVTKDVSFKLLDTYQASGKFIGLTQIRGKYENLDVTPTAITFENLDDKYIYTGTVSDNGYSINLRNGDYIASIECEGYSTTTHIVINNESVSKDILLKLEEKTEIPYSDTLYVGSDKEYKTVQSAVDAVSNMQRTDGQRVTIKIDPGIYREQVYVTAPNITLESNGGDRTNTKITWYYGIGYKYYSTVNNIYDPYADYDKYAKGDVVSYWGATVISKATATGFSAKGICFENSFNKYMTEEEIIDGAEPNGLQAINVARKENTEVDTRAATERAAAFVNYADKTEFLECGFIGSQDTLYTCNVNYKAYYKNCYIEGQTDYIYGNGDVVFDGCELNWCGYNGTEAAGYITAHSGSEDHLAKYGYVFRNCIITGNKEKNRKVVAGSFGRMWGTHATVNFINTQLEDINYLNAVGWDSGMNDPKLSTINVKEYNTTYDGNAIDTANRITGVVSDANLVKDYTVENIFINNGWTPVYYTNDIEDAPEILDNPVPNFTTNGDLNALNPGETLTVNYKLNDNSAANEASRISWYAVNTDYDNSSLTEILKSSTLLYTTAAYKTHKFQIPMECAGKYIMAVITPMTINGKTGTPKYVIETGKAVSDTWVNPDNPSEIPPGSGINIYLAGDSTVKDYSSKGMYNGGKMQDLGSWGEFFQEFFDENYVTVNNYANGGRALRSFMNEGSLDKIIKNIKSGDYLFIQFGHNDCANQANYYNDRFVPLYAQPKGADVKDAVVNTEGIVSGGIYPTVLPTEEMKDSTQKYTWNCGATYKGYIQAYINAAIDKGAIPIIVSPVARMYYDNSGGIRTHHDAVGTDYAPTKDYRTSGNAYVEACRQIYNENIEKGNQVYYIDGYNLTENMFKEAWKDSNNNTNGLAIMGKGGDSTHCNKVGGILEAGLFAKFVQDADLSISKYVIQPDTVYGETTNGEYIFTIKDKIFTAKDNEYKENSYVSEYGQQLFNSIGGSSQATVYTISGKTNLSSGTLDILDSNDKKVTSAEIENDGKYTFTITTMSDISKNSYFAKVDGYGKKEITMTASSSDSTVYTAEDIIFEKEIVVNKVSLDFDNGNTYTNYVTNADTTFTDGIYSGTYTNDDGQEFNASVYRAAIDYLADGRYEYGTRLNKNKALFSFTADEEKMYTLTVTSGAGSGTVNLFSDSNCTKSVANVNVPTTNTPVSIIYKKTSSEAETLYFAASESSNFYVKNVTVRKDELPQEEFVTFKGTIKGIESDDTNVSITFKSTTDTKIISYNEYNKNGVELIIGESYDITAVGNNGYYRSDTITPDKTGTAELTFKRFKLEFPFDLSSDFDSFSAYLTAMGYGSKDIEDVYSSSKIKIHNNGMFMYAAQYGAKANAEKMISFTAKQTGKCNVSVNVTVANNGNNSLRLKVNDNAVGDSTDVTATGMFIMSVDVKEGDIVTIFAPDRANLYYNQVDVGYTN